MTLNCAQGLFTARFSPKAESLMPITALSSSLPCTGAKGEASPALRVKNPKANGHFRRSGLIPGVEMSQIQQEIEPRPQIFPGL